MAARYAIFILLWCCFSRLSLAQIETPSTPVVADEDATPVRLAYFSFVEGEVEWRLDPDANASTLDDGEALSQNSDWSEATMNLPLRAGMEVRVPQNGRAEICFDDGSRLRLDSNSLLALETMTAEEGSEFTGLRLEGGRVTLKLKNADSLLQLQSGSTSLRVRGPASVRVDGNTDRNEIAVRAGRAIIENETGTLTLRAGQFLKTSPLDEQFAPGRLPAADSWEQWNLTRDDFLENDSLAGAQNLPQNISLVAGNLEQYGDWRDDAEQGRVWYPRVSQSDWRPYSIGQWSWVFPFGWTWVSGEPWGWAPYHYGSWICNNFGWGWVPGPAWQPWCPGVVSFFERDGERCWAPLSPWEVRYPSTPRRAWHNRFSIISTAVYFPGAGGYCEPRAWDASYINYVPNITYINYVTIIKRKKKIVYRCPDKNGHKSTRFRVDGAPDEVFDEVFGRPQSTPKPESQRVVSQSAGKEKPMTENRGQNMRGLLNGFVPRFARVRSDAQQAQRDGATVLSLENLNRRDDANIRSPKNKNPAQTVLPLPTQRRENVAPNEVGSKTKESSDKNSSADKSSGWNASAKTMLPPAMSTPRGSAPASGQDTAQQTNSQTENSKTGTAKREREARERDIKEREAQILRELAARQQALQQRAAQEQAGSRRQPASENAQGNRDSGNRDSGSRNSDNGSAGNTGTESSSNRAPARASRRERNRK
jgi:hypothetical protein